MKAVSTFLGITFFLIGSTNILTDPFQQNFQAEAIMMLLLGYALLYVGLGPGKSRGNGVGLNIARSIIFVFIGGMSWIMKSGTALFGSDYQLNFWRALILVISTLMLLYPAFLLFWEIYQGIYYKGKEFLGVKGKIASYTSECNELNDYIEELKGSGLISNKTDYGEASYQDASQWKYQRKYLKSRKYAPNIYNCSRTVCDNASKKPFEYICKYFGIKANEETLSHFEQILNNFEAVEDGKIRLQKQKSEIIEGIKKDIPFLIRKFSRKLEEKLGFKEIDMNNAYFPRYIFQYVSSGGNASTKCDIVMDIDNLNRFIEFLSEKIKFRKSVAGQRALMTSKLREHIKERDNFTCKICGASIYREPNLLLEVDHITPLAKGGITAEDNLQTLCWKCNRKKGAKIY